MTYFYCSLFSFTVHFSNLFYSNQFSDNLQVDLKSVSSHLLRQQNTHFLMQSKTGFLWSRSYFACSAGSER